MLTLPGEQVEGGMGECQACIYFKRINDRGGYCKRNPPTVVAYTVNDGAQVESLQPYVENKDYCGEFKDAQ